jgi:hypothetical protein
MKGINFIYLFSLLSQLTFIGKKIKKFV